jgi:hypothetical protein
LTEDKDAKERGWTAHRFESDGAITRLDNIPAPKLTRLLKGKLKKLPREVVTRIIDKEGGQK